MDERNRTDWKMMDSHSKPSVGGTVNAWCMATVTRTAYPSYRERLLMRAYGPELGVPVRMDAPRAEVSM